MNYAICGELILLFINVLNFSYEENNTPSVLIPKNYNEEIKHIKKFAKQHNYYQKLAFMIDYSLHFGLNRFFVANLKEHTLIKKGLVCHGGCKGQNKSGIASVFSNTRDSYCSTLGMAVVGERDYS